MRLEIVRLYVAEILLLNCRNRSIYVHVYIVHFCHYNPLSFYIYYLQSSLSGSAVIDYRTYTIVTEVGIMDVDVHWCLGYCKCPVCFELMKLGVIDPGV